MTALKTFDSVAYIRFASVYQKFENIDDFKHFWVSNNTLPYFILKLCQVHTMNKVPLSTMIIVTGVTTLTIFLAWCTSTQTPPQDKETILSHQDQLDTWHTDQNELIQDTGVNALDIQELKMLYAKYESADDVVWQVAVMRHLYQIKPNPTIQYKLITKYLEIYRYDDAFDLLQDALKQDNVDHKIIDQYLFVLFNSRQLNISNITKISHLVEKFYQTDKIDNDQLNMYDALLDIVGLNIPSFQQHVSALSDSGNYQQFKQDISQMLQLHSSYKDASKYYLVALWVKFFFNTDISRLLIFSHTMLCLTSQNISCHSKFCLIAVFYKTMILKRSNLLPPWSPSTPNIKSYTKFCSQSLITKTKTIAIRLCMPHKSPSDRIILWHWDIYS